MDLAWNPLCPNLNNDYAPLPGDIKYSNCLSEMLRPASCQTPAEPIGMSIGRESPEGFLGPPSTTGTSLLPCVNADCKDGLPLILGEN